MIVKHFGKRIKDIRFSFIRIFWIKREDLTKYVLADGFIKMLEVFENDNLSENYHWLENGEWMVQNK